MEGWTFKNPQRCHVFLQHPNLKKEYSGSDDAGSDDASVKGSVAWLKQ